MPVMNKKMLPKRIMIDIDLDGPDGNAFVILGYVKSIGRQVGFAENVQKRISEEMKKSDYDHLISVFIKYFNPYVNLWTSNDKLLKLMDRYVRMPVQAEDILEHDQD